MTFWVNCTGAAGVSKNQVIETRRDVSRRTRCHTDSMCEYLTPSNLGCHKSESKTKPCKITPVNQIMSEVILLYPYCLSASLC